MSHYNAAANLAPNDAGTDAFDFELAPFLPAMDQSGSWNPPLEVVSLHARAEFIGQAPARHHQRHASSPTHRCGACPASFHRNNQLEQHASENDHKAYLCICGKGYTRLSALRRHTEETTQTRNHSCPLCDRVFKRPGHVEQHLRLIHKNTDEVIKDLLKIQKSEPQQKLELTGTSSTAVPTTGSTEARVYHPMMLPGEPWAAQINFSPTVPATNPGPQPGGFPAFSSGFHATGTGFPIGFPDFSADSFMTQSAGFPSFPAGAMYTVQAAFSAGPAPNFISNPAPHLDEILGPFDSNQASVIMDPIDDFALSALEDGFMEDFYVDFDASGL